MLLNSRNRYQSPRSALWIGVVVMVLALAEVAWAATVEQKSFASPEEAVEALVAAGKQDDTRELLTIFGPAGKELLFSGDAVADDKQRERFVEDYNQKHHLVQEGNDTILVIGKDDWPFPIPLVKKSKRWVFDTGKGKEEILNRRIGQNELDAIQVCRAIVDAQREYAQKDRNNDELLEYAAKFHSDPGKKNGLSWASAPGEEQSPLGPLVTQAKLEGYERDPASDEPTPYHGYYYRILDAQGKNAPGGAYDYRVNGKLLGGFAVVAYPAEYGNSGVMTFITNHDGVVYQKDLGPKTATRAQTMRRFDPDKTWTKVDQDRDAIPAPGGLPPSISTANNYDTRIGALEFWNGVPTVETAQRVRDALDFTRALNVYNNSFRGASAYALGKGFQSIGAEDNTPIIFSDLMDASSLFLTANADTVYYMAVVNLTKGPMVIEQPPKGLGTINDMWFSWIIDIGFPGPDRGEGGKYLLLPPGYDGPLPEGGFFIAHSKTNRVLYAGRSFLVNDNPKPTVELIKQNLKIYPYTPGGVGTSIAAALEGTVRLAKNPPTPETMFVEGSGKAFNTIPPSDYGFFEMINENVQNEPATSYDVELAGQLAAIGIVKGKPFEPDARMKKILSDAAAVGNAAGRMLNWRYAVAYPEWSYYPDSMWGNMLWEGGAFFETPPPEFTKEGMFKPYPPTGARTLDARTAFYYAYTLDSPGMIMRIPGVGSQYLMGFLDSDGNPYDGGKTYKVTLPKNIPARAFWSLTLYDNQSRSMLDTPQRYPRAGSQSYPTPAAEPNADGSTEIYFGPNQPDGVPRGNWIQTMPGKGWFTLLRLYSPLETFFTKQWRPSEIEVVQ